MTSSSSERTPALRSLKLSPEVARAVAARGPVVALESTVITHGLPYPQNLQLAQDMERVVQAQGAVPATIALLDGNLRAGLDSAELERLASESGLRKISVRDVGPGLATGGSGGTTVAATILAARWAGIRVMATGGIGGVHRAPPWDVSADLPQLARTPVVVVCAGAKAILDLSATLEVLETQSVPVVGYQTDQLPAFYSADSGLQVPWRADSPGEVARLAREHWRLGLESAVLVVVPPPAEAALPMPEVESAVQEALAEAETQGVRGQNITPFLLERIAQLTGGASLQANLALLRNNGRVGAEIAVELARGAGARQL